jgi:6-phospho-beta-glucosidase
MLEVTVLGGGVSAASLCDALAARQGLDRPVRIRLAARRRERVACIARHASGRVAKRRPAWRVEASPGVTEALRGADIIVNLIRVGGPAARDWDERFPAAFGQVGDEGLGLGGIANAWRSAPVMERLAAAIAREAAGAVVLNMTAPLGVTTRCFIAAGVRAFGLCELPGLTRSRWLALPRTGAAQGAAAGATPPGGSAALSYCGLNHLGWFWPANAAGEAALEAAVRAGDVDTEIYGRFGAAPLHYYATVFDQPAAVRLGRTFHPGRASELAALSDSAFEAMRTRPGSDIPELARRSTPWFERAVAPMIDAVTGGGRFDDFLNLPGEGGWLPGSPANAVVEVPVEVASGRIARPPQPPPPRPVSEFLLACATSQDLLSRAAAARDRGMLAQAIEALPLEIPRARLDEIVTRIVEGERFAPSPDLPTSAS